MALSLSWAARSRMASNSAFCSAVLSPFLDGQSMLPTVATQAARNSRTAWGGRTEQRSYVAARGREGARSAKREQRRRRDLGAHSRMLGGAPVSDPARW